jgi:hypothetical protein
MNLRILFALALVVAAAGCGVKSDLERPGQQNEQDQRSSHDPSKPPSPLGR